MQNQTEATLANQRIDQIYRITTSLSSGIGDQLAEILKESTQLICMEIGILSKITHQTYEIIDFYAEDRSILQQGQTFPLGDTYCHITYQQDGLVDINHMKKSPLSGHPCYRSFGLEAYIGVPIWVENRKYGTLNFSSPNPRKKVFNQFDRDFVMYLGQWISNLLTKDLFEQKLSAKNSELQRVNAELSLKNTYLADLLLERQTLTETLVHDLKAPLNNGKMLISLIGMTSDEETRATSRSMLKKTLDNAMRLVSNLEAIHELEQEEVETFPEEFELNEVCQNLSNQFEGYAQEKDISLNFLPDNGEIQVHNDPAILERIVSNLLSNAIKFSPLGTSVDLFTVEKDHEIQIRIVDRGPGISREDQHKMFGRFCKLSARPTNKESSTGLGLYIVKELSELIGASIRVESELGQGSCFELTLPKSKSGLRPESAIQQHHTDLQYSNS